jgi:hypothetical protein
MAKLARDVAVDGQWYGPSYGDADVPDEVAKRITNPRAWPDGEVPVEATGGSAGTDAADKPSEGDSGAEKAGSARASRARKKG